MKKLIKNSLVAVALCLVMSAGALPSGKTKAFQIFGHKDGVIVGGGFDADLKMPYFETLEDDSGVTTHAGRHSGVGHMRYYMDATGNVVGAGGYGDWTGANGKATMDWVTPYASATAASARVDLTMGHGTWDGVTGYFISSPSNVVVTEPTGEEPGKISYDYKGSGYLVFP